MNRIISIIESKGSFTDKETKKEVAFNNLIFWLDSGSQLYTNETLVKGTGKPLQIKIKRDVFDKLSPLTIDKINIGMEMHVYQEQNEVVQISIK